MKISSVILIAVVIVGNAAYGGSLRVTANPPARSMATMITDAENERIILFGGQNYQGSNYGGYFNDLWALDLSDEGWKRISVTGSAPSPRRNPALAYHSTTNQMYLFGGRNGDTFLNDVWVLDLSQGSETWTQLSPSGTPPEQRTEVTGIIDPVSDRLILFGGDFGYSRTNQTWSLDLNTLTWSQLYPSGPTPLARSAYAAVYDESEHRMIVFSGCASPMVSDVWALDLTYGDETWEQLNTSGGPPEARGQCFCALDEENNAMIVGFGFDWQGYIEYLSDVWALDLGTLTWSLIVPSSIVDSRRGSCGSYNPLNGEVIIFGGDNYGSYSITYALNTAPVAITENRKACVAITPYIEISSNPSQLPCQISAYVPSPSTITLKIFDLSGRLITTLIQGEKRYGAFDISWDGADAHGKRVPSSTYFIALEIDGTPTVKKMVLVK